MLVAAIQTLFFAISVASLQAVPQDTILGSEVVDVFEEVLTKRSDGKREYKLKAFGQDIDLKLSRNDNLLPEDLRVYVYGEDEDGNPTVDDWTHKTNGPQSLYTDVSRGASLMIDEVFDEPKLSGMLGDNLVIEPVEDVTIDDADNVEKRESTKKLRHVVYKVQPKEEKATVNDFIAKPDQPVVEDTKEKRAVPNVIYVPVHIVIDYSLWKKLGQSESDIIRYMKIFYNSVNVVYSTITQPFVSVSIQGITICKSASACAMVENSRLGTDAVNAKTALDDIAKYAYSKRSSTGTNYALMMVMTDYDLCSPSGTTCERSTAGLAFVGTVCDDYRFSKTSKTGIAEDHGAYDGVKTVAHEMGHLLGMNHDGDGADQFGAPGARSCSWNDNYLMGQTAFVLNQFKWSRCSVDQLRWTASQPSANCLLQKPSSAPYPLINNLPGKEIDLNNQCKILIGQSSEVGCRLPGVNSGNDEICLGLMCKTSSRGCVSKVSAAEGSYCGPQRYCRAGKCVCDPTAPLPTPPPEDPSCVSDNSRIRINGKSCVNLLTAPDGLDMCESDLVKRYCCKSRTKYCRADPIKCDGSGVPVPVTYPTNPTTRATPSTTTTRRPTSQDNCGNTCEDTPFMLINGQKCTDLLSTTSNKRSLCDNPTVIQHCCDTRAKLCSGYHWITESCDPLCQDNPGSKINGQGCIPFLNTGNNRQYYCDHNLVRNNCCATRRQLCPNGDGFGK